MILVRTGEIESPFQVPQTHVLSIELRAQLKFTLMRAVYSKNLRRAYETAGYPECPHQCKLICISYQPVNIL